MASVPLCAQLYAQPTLVAPSDAAIVETQIVATTSASYVTAMPSVFFDLPIYYVEACHSVAAATRPGATAMSIKYFFLALPTEGGQLEQLANQLGVSQFGTAVNGAGRTAPDTYGLQKRIMEQLRFRRDSWT